MPYARSIRQRPLEHEGRSIWRYMPLWKFEDMMRGRLFFTRLRHIVDSEIDPWEGDLADINFEEPSVNVDWVLREVLTPGQEQDTIEMVKRQYGDPVSLRRERDWGRDYTFINCWFTDEWESKDMWREYVPHGRGVVVQSTIRRLRDSIDPAPIDVYIQPVIYYDRATRQMVPVDPFHTPLYKHIDYRREKELRCFVLAPGNCDVHPDGIGALVPCDLGRLVERIRVPPGAEDGLVNHVVGLIQAAQLSMARVERSALERAGARR